MNRGASGAAQVIRSTRECLAFDVARHLRSDDVPYRLAELCPPDHIRSDNGSEFTAKADLDAAR